MPVHMPVHIHIHLRPSRHPDVICVVAAAGSLLSGRNESEILTLPAVLASPTPSASPGAILVSYGTGLSEQQCQSANHAFAVWRLEADAAFNSELRLCTTDVETLRSGGQRFGPPSPWEVFQRVCRTCSHYTEYLTTIQAAGGCDCRAFEFNKCSYKDASDMVCDAVQLCDSPAQYQLDFCDAEVCVGTQQSLAVAVRVPCRTMPRHARAWGVPLQLSVCMPPPVLRDPLRLRCRCCRRRAV
jgi:hypothetical protein